MIGEREGEGDSGAGGEGKGATDQRPAGSVEAATIPGTPRRRNFVLTVGTNLTIMGLTFVTGTLNARLLGPSGRGELAAIQNIPGCLGTIALLGLPSAVGYYTARRPHEARALALTAATMCLAASLPFILIGYLMMPWALSSQTAVVVHDARIYLWLIVLQSVNLIPYVALQGLGQFALWNVLRVAPNVATLVAIGAAWLMHSPYAGTVAHGLLIASWLIVPFTYTALWRRSVPGVPGTPLRIGELFRYGLPSALMIPAGLLNLQLDQLVLAAWLPSRMLGLYAVGVSWSALISPIFNALGSVIFPTLAAAQDAQAQRAIVGRAFRLAVLVVLVLGIGLAAVTPLLLPLVFGSSFRAAVPSALVLVAASMVLNLNNLGGEILRGLGVPRWTLYSQLFALPVTIVSLIVLLPRLSIVGAAVSSVLAYLVAGIVSVLGIGRTCHLSASDLFPRKGDVAELLELVRHLVASRWRRTA